MELKNISLIKNKNNLINIGLIVLALIIAKNIYSGQGGKIEKLRANKTMELKKNALIGDIGRLEKRIDAYKKVLYKRDTSSIINSITQIAGNSQIKITSVKPEEEKEYAAYNQISVKVSIVAADYHKIGDFISKLENAPDFYIIEEFSIRPLIEKSEAREADRLSADLRVIAIIFKG